MNLACVNIFLIICVSLFFKTVKVESFGMPPEKQEFSPCLLEI